MRDSLSIDDLKNCSLIIDRGLFFYNKLKDNDIKESFKNRNQISELSFYIRSLSEITAGIELWFKSYENIKVLADAALIDLNHYFIKGAKHTKRQGKELNPFTEQLIEDAKDKYYAVPYPDGNIEIAQHRRSDELFQDTQIITSKFIHQDEYSILGVEKHKIYDSSTVDRLEGIAIFWCRDFKNRMVLTNNQFPEVIKYYEENFNNLPFDYSGIELSENT